MQLTIVSSKIPYGPSFPQNTKRFNHLNKTRVEIKKNLDQKLGLALNKCNAESALTDSSNISCAVLWDEIEECASKITDIDQVLSQYWECWDDIECRMYDL